MSARLALAAYLSASRDRVRPDFGVFHPGITPLAPGLGPARVDHWVSIEPVAIAVSRLRQSPAIAAPLDRWTQCIKTVTTRLRRIAASSLSRAGE